MLSWYRFGCHWLPRKIVLIWRHYGPLWRCIVLLWITWYLNTRFVLLWVTSLTHCRLNRLSHTIYWKSPISILGTYGYEIYIFLEKNGLTISKQWRPWSDAAFCSIWSGSALFASYPFKGLPTTMGYGRLWNNFTWLQEMCFWKFFTPKYLMLSTLGKIFSRWHLEIFFLFFSRKQDLTFHTNCLH